MALYKKWCTRTEKKSKKKAFRAYAEAAGGRA